MNRILQITLLILITFYCNAQLIETPMFKSVAALQRISGGGGVPDSLTNGLVGLWALDDDGGTTAADSSGLVHNGSFVNLPQWEVGYVGLNSIFVNPSEYINIADTTDHHFGTSDFSLSYHYASTNITGETTGIQVLIGKIAGSLSGDSYWSGNNGGEVEFALDSDSITTSTATYDDGLWHTVTCVRSNGVGFLWVDGALQGTHSMTGSASPSGGLSIGQFGDYTGGYQATAWIDDVRLYNRALTTTEVARIYAMPNVYSLTIATNSGTAIYLMTPKSNPSTTNFLEYFMGRGEGANAVILDTLKRDVAHALLTNGYAIASFEGGPLSWGNASYLKAATNCFTWATNHGNYTKFVAIMQSMGGVGGNHMMTLQIGNSFSRCYEIYPVFDLGYVYTNSTTVGQNSTFPSEIESAYGFSGGANFSAATAGFNPFTLATNLYGHAIYRATGSESDQVVDVVHNAETLTNYLKFSSFMLTGGNHGDPSNFQPNDVLTFFNQ